MTNDVMKIEFLTDNEVSVKPKIIFPARIGFKNRLDR